VCGTLQHTHAQTRTHARAATHTATASHLHGDGVEQSVQLVADGDEQCFAAAGQVPQQHVLVVGCLRRRRGVSAIVHEGRRGGRLSAQHGSDEPEDLLQHLRRAQLLDELAREAKRRQPRVGDGRALVHGERHLRAEDRGQREGDDALDAAHEAALRDRTDTAAWR
jgi:hypothetical protein